MKSKYSNYETLPLNSIKDYDLNYIYVILTYVGNISHLKPYIDLNILYYFVILIGILGTF